MKQSTLENHTNASPGHNCTHAEAWAVAWAIKQWSIWNVVYWFQPPMVHSVSIIPERLDLVDPEDRFEASMFQPSGTFYTTSLNHYIRLRINGGKEEFWANAGILLEEFRISHRRGYRMLKEFIIRAKEEFAQIGTTEGGTSQLQETSASLPGRDSSVSGGVNN